jgi:HAD superfamily phosphoserine phosphatase-like hydrolase
MMKAIIYDFDGTLTPDLLPKFEILDKAGLEGGMYNPKFMEMSTTKAKNENLELFEAMILVILDTMRNAGIKVTNDNLALGAATRSYNPGVEEFLRALQERGVDNYILSSGAKAYLEQTAIASYFKSIYASTLEYDNNGEVTGIELVMTAPQKARVLANIATSVNGSEDDCSDVIYIGDGPTDLHAMEFIKAHGGKNILVYHDIDSDDVIKMREAEVVDNFVPADFRPGGELWQLVFSMI